MHLRSRILTLPVLSVLLLLAADAVSHAQVHNDPLWSMRGNRTGRFRGMDSTGDTILIGYFDPPSMRLWNVRTGTLLRTYGLFTSDDAFIQGELLSPNGRFIMRRRFRTHAVIVDAHTGRSLDSFEIGDVLSVDFSRDSKRALASTWDDTHHFLTQERGTYARSDGATQALFAYDHQYVVSFRDRLLQRTRVGTFSVVWSRDMPEPIEVMKMTDSGRVAVLQMRNSFAVVNAENGALLWSHANRSVSHIATSRKDLIATIGTPFRPNELRLFRYSDSIPVATYELSIPRTSMAFSADGSELMILATDGRLVVLDAMTGTIKRTAIEGAATYYALFNPSGDEVYRFDHSGRIDVHAAATGELLRNVDVGYRSSVIAGSSARGFALLKAADDKSAQHEMWDLTQSRIRYLDDRPIVSADFSGDGALIAVGRDSGDIEIMQTGDGALVKKLTGLFNRGVRVAMSRTGAYVAAAYNNHRISIYTSDGATVRADLGGHSGAIRWMTFSSDDRYLYSGGLDGRIVRWKIADGSKGTVAMALPALTPRLHSTASGGFLVAPATALEIRDESYDVLIAHFDDPLTGTVPYAYVTTDPAARRMLAISGSDLVVWDLAQRLHVRNTASSSNALRLSIHPNITRDEARLTVQLPRHGSVRIRVVAMTGEVVHDATVETTSETTSVTIPTHAMSPGMYRVTASASGATTGEALVITR